MSVKLGLEYANFALAALCVLVPMLMWRKGLIRQFPLPLVLLVAQGLDAVIKLATLYFRKPLGMNITTSINLYFYGGWILSILTDILRIVIIYSVFQFAMRPLEGLHRLGKIVFRWVAGVSILSAGGFAAGARLAEGPHSATDVFTHFASQAVQGISILTLCLLLFVCFATKPLGLTYGSRLFGITLGLGVLATTDLVQGAWSSTSGAHSVYSGVYLFGAIGVCAAISTWAVYFAMPEPARRMILLPTTSPFFMWNKISEALGDHPGQVAVAGLHPSMLATAEMEMLTAPDKVTRVTDYSLPELQAAAQY
jgi:hypothetical protein